MDTEIRRIQALTGERSFTLVFPKHFAVQLGIGKGDFLKCHLEGSRLIVEKVNSIGRQLRRETFDNNNRTEDEN